MASKPKIAKKGYDSHGSSYIALGGGARAKETSSSTTDAKDAATLKSSSSAGSALSNLVQATADTSKARIAQPSSSSNLASAAAATTNTNNLGLRLTPVTQLKNFRIELAVEIFLLSVDPKTIKDEIVKLLEKDDATTTEKLTKIVRALIFNLKPTSTVPVTPPGMPIKQQQQLLLAQQQQQVQQQQQPDLNFLMALSFLALKRPQLFLKQPMIVEVTI